MNPVSRGIRNAFRNLTRTFSIIIILGLSIGLALTMLVAHQAVTSKINSVKASVGNTVAITPAGFSGFSSVNNSLTTSELQPITKLAHVSSITESFTARLSNSSSGSALFNGPNSNSNATTNLTSPVTINPDAKGGHFFFAGGGGAGTLPTNFSPPISLLATNNPSSVNSTNVSITSGKIIDGNANNDQALVSQKMASKNNLKVGSTFTAYSTTLTVAGIFSSSTQGADNTVVVSLPTGQTISGQAGDVTEATVYVDSLDNLSSVTSAVKNKLGSNADITSSIDEANNAVAPLNSVKSISVYSLIGAVIAGAVIILLTMVMIVRERTKEIGVVKAIGASNRKISFQFMSEAATLTVLGAVIGIFLTVVAASPITHTLVSSSVSSSTSSRQSSFGGPGNGPVVRSFAGGTTRLSIGGRGAGGFLRDNFSNINAVVGWSTIIYGLLSAIVIALIGSTAVSYFIAKIRPAEVMRTE